MIKTMKALVRREFWENRGAFVKTPIIVGIVFLVLTIGAYITTLVLSKKTGSDEILKDGVLELASIESGKLGIFWDMQVLSSSTLYFMILFFIIFFYLLGSLFDDRKDQSILFWKSLPVSDALTVSSKLLTALLFAPLVFMGIYVIVFFAEMILFSIILMIHGLNPIKLVWIPMNYFATFKLLFLGIVAKMLWGLPVYGWLMFSSAVSKRRPFLFAVLIPLLVSAIWYWINVLTFKFTNWSMFKEPLRYLSHGLFPYASTDWKGEKFRFEIEDGSTINAITDGMINSMLGTKIVYGAIFFVVFFTLSIWIRRYRNTI